MIMATQYRVQKYKLSDSRIVYTPQMKVWFWWTNIRRWAHPADGSPGYMEPLDFHNEALANHWIVLAKAKEQSKHPKKLTRKVIA
jgi:hypothetical protein